MHPHTFMSLPDGHTLSAYLYTARLDVIICLLTLAPVWCGLFHCTVCQRQKILNLPSHCLKDPLLASRSYVVFPYLAKGADAVDLVRYNLDGLPRLIGDLVRPCLCLQASHHLHVHTQQISKMLQIMSMPLWGGPVCVSCSLPSAEGASCSPLVLIDIS